MGVLANFDSQSGYDTLKQAFASIVGGEIGDFADDENVRGVGENTSFKSSAPATLERPGAGPGGTNSMTDHDLSQPLGYCQCGCGGKTRIAPRNSKRWGWVKGQPVRYLPGHHARRAPWQGPLPACACGCGQAVTLATSTNPHKGTVKGEPLRYRMGHSGNRGRKQDLAGAYAVNPETGCWEWQRHINRGGYATLGAASGGIAHRFFYERAKGPIPQGMHLDHLCRVRHCVNPDHLEPVTNTENARRGSNTKITAAIAAEIKIAIASGDASTVIAKRFDVTPAIVYGIKYGRTWGDV